LLISEFRSNPTLFYTENDLVCFFFTILRQNLPFFESPDKGGRPHSLIHSQYPTPFRCDMGKSRFQVKDDNARNEKGGKYQRGHYDIVILNPDFINHHTFDVIKAQTYEDFKKEINFDSWKDNPMILYGIEFMYSRNPLKWSRGNNKEREIDRFISSVIQDTNKLLASKRLLGFMGKVKMLTFIKGSSEDVCSLVNERLSWREEITICFAE
jgi:hypothetical protein